MSIKSAVEFTERVESLNQRMRAALDRDINAETGRILHGQSLLLPTEAHLQAMAVLLKDAYSFINESHEEAVSHETLIAWSLETRKILFGSPHAQ